VREREKSEREERACASKRLHFLIIAHCSFNLQQAQQQQQPVNYNNNNNSKKQEQQQQQQGAP